MKLSVALLALAFVMGCGKKEAAQKKPDDSAAAGGNPVTAPLDYLSAQGRAKQTAIKVTSLAEVTQAIQKFHAMEDRYPRDLSELVQERYLAALPPSPRGAQLFYNPQTGDVRFIAAPANPPSAPASPATKLPGLKTLPSQPVSPP